jgi:hypothetical protein
MQLCRRILLASLALGLSASVVQACPDHTKTAAASTPAKVTSLATRVSPTVAWKPRAWQPAAFAAQGLRIQIDPVDGTRSMPSDADLGVNAMIEREDTPVRQVRHADGTVQAFLDGRFMDYSVARMGADGKPVWNCVSGTKGVEQFMKSAAQPAVRVIVTSPAVQREEM